MTDTKHTPGEWRNAGKGCHVLIAVAAGDLDICYLVRNPEQEANANLIAASKELLAYAEAEQAAEDHRVACKFCGYKDYGCWEWEELRDDAEVLRIAALAKVRGEEPIVRPEPIRVPGNEVTRDLTEQAEIVYNYEEPKPDEN